MFTRRELLDAAKPHFGGGTSSTPVVPDEFKPLIDRSVGTMVGQQGANPIGAYNGANPMDVQGLTSGQQFGMGAMMGSYENNPLQYMAAQAAQRAAGMSGAGPTTGQYDPSGEMGLQDWANYMKPYLGTGGEMGDQQAPDNQFNDGVNVNPQGVAQTNFQGGAPNMSGAPPGGPSGGGSGGPSPGGQPGSMPPQNMAGAQFYRDPMGQLRRADPSQAGQIAGTGLHGQGAYDSNGMLQNFFTAASQGQGPGQIGAGTMSARPTDPAAAAAWDQVMANHHGATVGSQPAPAAQGMSLQQAMGGSAADQNYLSHLANRGAEGQAQRDPNNWAAAQARAAQIQASNPTPHPKPAASAMKTASVKAQA